MANSTTGVNILTIDGGALKGVIPARILSYLDGTATETLGCAPIKNIASLPNSNALNGWFNIIGGTSTGGLLAACLSVPKLSSQPNPPANTGNDTLQFYVANASNIFPTSDLEYLGNAQLLTTMATMYGNSGLAEVISSMYGAPSWANDVTRHPASGVPLDPFTPFSANPIKLNDNNPPPSPLYLKDAPNTVLLTSFNANIASISNPMTQFGISIGAKIDSTTTPPGPQLLTKQSTVLNPKNIQEPLSVLQACLMTSAFPVLLPPVPADLQFGAKDADGADVADSGNINYFVDGGVFAGNPAFAVYLYCLENNITINNFISIGCGSGALNNPPYSTVQYSGFNPPILGETAWNNALIDMMLKGPGMTIDQFLSFQLSKNGGRYFRLDPIINSSAAAWSSNASDLASWIKDTDTYIESLINPPSGAPFSWADLINAIQGQSTSS